MAAEREQVDSPFEEPPAPEPGSAVEEAMNASAPEGATRAPSPTGASVDDHAEGLASSFPGLDDEIMESLPTQRMQSPFFPGETPEPAAKPPPQDEPAPPLPPPLLPALPTVKLCPIPAARPRGPTTVTLTMIPSIQPQVSPGPAQVSPGPPPLPPLDFQSELNSDPDEDPIAFDLSNPGGGLFSERPTVSRTAVVRPSRGRRRTRRIFVIVFALVLFLLSVAAYAWWLMMGLRLSQPVPAVSPPAAVRREPPVTAGKSDQPKAVPVIAALAEPAPTELPPKAESAEPSFPDARVGNPQFIQGARGWLVRVPLSAAVKVKVFELQNPLRIVVDLFKTAYPGKGRSFPTPIPFIAQFRVAQRNRGTRVVLDVKASAVKPYHARMLPSGLSIQFDK